MLSDAEIERRFNHNSPTAERAAVHERIRAIVRQAAAALACVLPACREAALAFTALETVGFWANAAIARPATAEG